MNNTNKEIRVAAYINGLNQYEVAELIGMNESAFSRKLRKELPKEEKQRIIDAIENFVKENNNV
jgi:predicted transcriptional regulator